PPTSNRRFATPRPRRTRRSAGGNRARASAMRLRKGLVVLGALVALALVSRLPSTSGQSAAPALSTSNGSHASSVTWSKEIVPIVQQHCQGCHRPGDIGPFSLVSYDSAYRERQKILRAVERRKMPPWKPVQGFGEFR